MTYEIVQVTATFLKQGDTLPYEELLKLERQLISYDDLEASSIWDVLNDPDISDGVGIITSPIVTFSFHPIAPGLVGMIEAASAGEEDAVLYSNDLSALLRLARKQYQNLETDFTVPDTCSFAVVYQCEATSNPLFVTRMTFLGELDFAKLPLALVEVEDANG